MHDIQKKNFSEYNEEIYISEDYKYNEASKEETLTSEDVYYKNEIIKQRKVWKKTVKQIKIIVKKVFNVVWKSQKSESSIELYNFRWILAENDTQNEVL